MTDERQVQEFAEKVSELSKLNEDLRKSCNRQLLDNMALRGRDSYYQDWKIHHVELTRMNRALARKNRKIRKMRQDAELSKESVAHLESDLAASYTELKEVKNQLKIAEIATAGAGSLLLDVQQDCITLQQENTELKSKAQDAIDCYTEVRDEQKEAKAKLQAAEARVTELKEISAEYLERTDEHIDSLMAKNAQLETERAGVWQEGFDSYPRDSNPHAAAPDAAEEVKGDG